MCTNSDPMLIIRAFAWLSQAWHNEGHLSKGLGKIVSGITNSRCLSLASGCIGDPHLKHSGRLIEESRFRCERVTMRQLCHRKNKRTHHRVIGYCASNTWAKFVGIQRRDNPCGMDSFRKDAWRRGVRSVRVRLTKFWMKKKWRHQQRYEERMQKAWQVHKK